MVVSTPSSAARGTLKLRWRWLEMALWSERSRVCGLLRRPWRVGGGRRRKASGAEFGGALDGGWFKACRRFGVIEGASSTWDVGIASFGESDGVAGGIEVSDCGFGFVLV